MPGPITRHTRRATPVEALHLGDPRDLHLAEVWMRGHGVESAHRHPALAARGLLVPAGPGGVFTIARQGQWLVRDELVGEFAVLDDDVFTTLHLPRLADVLEVP